MHDPAACHADLRPEHGAGLHDGVRGDDAAGPKLGASLDDRERPDLHVGGELGGGMDLGAGVNHREEEEEPPKSSSWVVRTIS